MKLLKFMFLLLFIASCKKDNDNTLNNDKLTISLSKKESNYTEVDLKTTIIENSDQLYICKINNYKLTLNLINEKAFIEIDSKNYLIELNFSYDTDKENAIKDIKLFENQKHDKLFILPTYGANDEITYSVLKYDISTQKVYTNTIAYSVFDIVANKKAISVYEKNNKYDIKLNNISQTGRFTKQSNPIGIINQNTNLNQSDDSDSEVIKNFALSKNFSFKFLVSKVYTEGEDNKKQTVKIILTNNQTKSIQKIDFSPQSLVVKLDLSDANCLSYFDRKTAIIKTTETKKNTFSFIVLDINFDGLEDFAIIDFEGSNAGPQYAYFIQNPNKQFELNPYLTEYIRFIPKEMNKNEKTITISYVSGCCQIQTYKGQYQTNGEWKEVYSKLEDIN